MSREDLSLGGTQIVRTRSTHSQRHAQRHGWSLILKQTIQAWVKHNTPRLAAALAFYTLLALSPMVVLVLAALSMVMGRASAQSRIIVQAQWLFGLEGSKAVAFLLHNARRPGPGWFASVVGIATLVLGASGVTGELRSGMNTIWNRGAVPASPVRRAIYDRSFSLGMVSA